MAQPLQAQVGLPPILLPCPAPVPHLFACLLSSTLGAVDMRPKRTTLDGQLYHQLQQLHALRWPPPSAPPIGIVSRPRRWSLSGQQQRSRLVPLGVVLPPPQPHCGLQQRAHLPDTRLPCEALGQLDAGQHVGMALLLLLLPPPAQRAGGAVPVALGNLRQVGSGEYKLGRRCKCTAV